MELVTLLYVPAPQVWHVLVPVPVLYVPARQERHAAEEIEPEPVLNEPDEQVTHVLTPMAVLYVPLGQAVQALNPRPEANVPALHWVQTADDQEFGVLLNVPMAQSVQVTVPF